MDILLSIFTDWVKRRGPKWAYLLAVTVVLIIIAGWYVLNALYGD